jgi:hypothetical protein
MKTLSNKQIIERSSLFLDLSKSLLNKIDLFLTNTNLSKNDQEYLIELMEEVYGQGYENSSIDDTLIS